MAEGTHDDAETLVLPAATAGRVAPDDVLPRLQALGFGEYAARALRAHFLDAERTGRTGHGLSRIPWLETLPGLDPAARPERVVAEDGYERWEGRGTVGYLVLEAIVRAQLADPPVHARVIAASDCFPTGMLGHYARRLAEGGLVCAITATSPPRLAPPDGGPALASTSPLAIAIPSTEGAPVVTDVSMAKANWGDALTGAARPEDVIPFGGEQAHKAFALAVGLQLLVDRSPARPAATGRCCWSPGPSTTPCPRCASGRRARGCPATATPRRSTWRRPRTAGSAPRAPAAKECSERWRIGRT